MAFLLEHRNNPAAMEPVHNEQETTIADNNLTVLWFEY